MKTCAFLVLSIAASASALAANCNDVKSAVAAKLNAMRVTKYTLDIVPREKVSDSATVVGSCEGGTKKIVYTRK